MMIDRLQQMPGHLIRRAQQVSIAIFSEELAGFDLTSVQLVALAAIIDQPGLVATRLAERIDFDKATIGAVVERLVRKGLVVRSASTADRRVKQLTATKAGEDLVATAMPSVEQVQTRMLSPLVPEERATLLALLSRVVESHEAKGAAG